MVEETILKEKSLVKLGKAIDLFLKKFVFFLNIHFELLFFLEIHWHM